MARKGRPPQRGKIRGWGIILSLHRRVPHPSDHLPFLRRRCRAVKWSLICPGETRTADHKCAGRWRQRDGSPVLAPHQEKQSHNHCHCNRENRDQRFQQDSNSFAESRFLGSLAFHRPIITEYFVRKSNQKRQQCLARRYLDIPTLRLTVFLYVLPIARCTVAGIWRNRLR